MWDNNKNWEKVSNHPFEVPLLQQKIKIPEVYNNALKIIDIAERPQISSSSCGVLCVGHP